MTQSNDTVNYHKDLIKQYYWFLVDKYGFEFDERDYSSSRFDFYSSDIMLRINVGREAPTIEIRRKGEPDYIYTLLAGVTNYMRYRYPGIKFYLNSLEDNIKFSSSRFEKLATRIFKSIDKWWIPIQIQSYKRLEKLFKRNNQMREFSELYQKERDYLISKGALKEKA